MSVVPAVRGRLNPAFAHTSVTPPVHDRLPHSTPGAWPHPGPSAVHSVAVGETLAAPLISAGAAVAVAVIGWLLYAWYRRRDHRRADLTDTAHTLGAVDLEVRRLSAACRALITTDFAALEGLLLRVQRAAARCGRGRRLKPLQQDLLRVGEAITRYTATTTAACADVARAHLTASGPDQVPAALELTAFVRAVQQQVCVGEQLAAAVHAAEERVERLRAA